jgi:hypothetical protein
LFKKPGAALPIHKGIASVDSLEGGLGNMREHESRRPDGGESSLGCGLCSNGAIYPV